MRVQRTDPMGSGSRAQASKACAAVQGGSKTAQRADSGLRDLVGNTPVVRLMRLPGRHSSSEVYAKLEGSNPASSVKDRPALSMIEGAERRGEIVPGHTTLLEATSGNTGIALAMAAAAKGYALKLVMPENQSEERKQTMAAYGAELVLVDAGNMEQARDVAFQLQREGSGTVLNQFGNSDNPAAHYHGTAPEIAQVMDGQLTHFVATLGTTGTVTGCGTWFKENMPDVNVVGVLPDEQSGSIPGIRNWPPEYQPTITREDMIDRKMLVTQRESEEMARALARIEGIFAGTSSGGSISAAIRLAAEVDNASIVAIVCDRGDRYLSTGLFSTSHSRVPAQTNVREFFGAAARLTGLPKPLVYFRGFWCPDCQRCDGAIKRAAERRGASLLVCDVGEREDWKSEEHPFRRHRLLQLQCLPTLAEWDEGAIGECLSMSLERSQSEEEAEVMVEQWLGRDTRCGWNGAA